MNMKTVVKNFDRIDTRSIPDNKLAKRVSRLQAKRKQGGFTLLELLVVVAILAAIAGTATIALQDTDARASAAAHVAMMDELGEGIHTYRVLNSNKYPNHFDSLIQADDAAIANPVALSVLAVDPLDYDLLQLTADSAAVLDDIGMSEMMYVAVDQNPPDAGDCGATNTLAELIANRGNAVVAGNIFKTSTANGCGVEHTLALASPVMVWTGGYERILGASGVAFDATPIATDDTNVTAGIDDAPVLMMVGLGSSSSLFDTSKLGGLTSVPVYRHVSGTEYNRFIALFNIGTIDTAGTGAGYVAVDQVAFVAVVDGAGDTKEEELGEWDGTRNTI